VFFLLHPSGLIPHPVRFFKPPSLEEAYKK